jgi:hypothetical protein
MAAGAGKGDAFRFAFVATTRADPGVVAAGCA